MMPDRDADTAAYDEMERHARVLIDDALTVGDDRIAIISLLVAAFVLHLRRSGSAPSPSLIGDCETLAVAICAGGEQ